ncbi:LacI family DNA-binding transcriptional regulator [Bifidobacterium sp. AGR2158]|uniref:LacI family DNA-binding transcriptional regulator n=1 Tax=Bifidobacterium sp. AGR2158 TaxID=1280675 RepID=UPI00047C20F7|nr:LacI family DNA-binding transcriptional regulator [Bifidobacterium sp. AGR2158]
MSRRVTLKEVAKEAQVSPATVSLVLNNKPSRIAKETQQRIRDVAARLHYVVNENARGLVTNETRLIALIVPDIENMFFASLARHLEDACQEAGYALFLSNSDDRRANESALMTNYLARDIDGMLLIPSLESYRQPRQLQRQIAAAHCPVTLIDRLVTARICDGVGFDNVQGGRLAARRLLEARHRRFACISGQTDDINASNRMQGFVDVLRSHHIDADDILLLNGNYRFTGGYELADCVLDFGATGLFCCNDLMAMGAMQRLAEHDLHVPQALSIVGYDNIMRRFGMTSQLTTVEQDVHELAVRSWECLYRHIRLHDTGRDCATATSVTLLEPRIVEGATVADAPAKVFA